MTVEGNAERFTRRHFLRGALAGGFVLPGAPSVANARGQGSNVTGGAIARGLHWLASRQKGDGGFGSEGAYSRNVGICSLCGLAFLAEGLRGVFHANLLGCTDYLLDHAREDGFIIEERVVTHAPTYGHGFAVMYLGQVHGTDLRVEIRDVLQRGVDRILASQKSSGGWRYTAIPGDEDVSVTSCQLLALCSARQAGISVPRSAIDHGASFLRKGQNQDGGFRYRIADPPESFFPRSAAAVATLHAIGDNEEAVAKGRRYLLTAPNEIPRSAHGEFYYYGRFHATYVWWQAGGVDWRRWYSTVRDELLKRQQTDGRWHDPVCGDEYATAMALLVLQMPSTTAPVLLAFYVIPFFCTSGILGWI